MELPELAQAQQIGLGAISDNPDTGPATIGTSDTGTTSPPPQPQRPPPTPTPFVGSSIFTPGLIYGGGISQSGESLAEELEQQAGLQSYNMKVGPVQLRANASINTAFNDNIGISQHNRMADITVVPFATLLGNWPVSDLNSINFDLGIGYQMYLLNSQYDSLLLAPDSQFSFNFFAGEVAFNLHDILSYEQDPTQVGQVSNQVRLARFNNDAGISATRDFDQITVELDYDHSNLWVTDSIYDYLTNQSDTISPTITYKVNETIKAGVNGSFSSTRYEQSFQNDSLSESLGPFVKASLSDKLSISAAAGGFLSQYSNGGGNGDSSNIASYYANFGINHRINDVLTENLTAGKEFLPGLTSNYTEELYLNYGISWAASQNMSLGSQLFWQNLDDSDAAFRENSNIFGLSINMADYLSQSLTLNLGYQFIIKEASPSYLSYNQNVGSLGLQYNF